MELHTVLQDSNTKESPTNTHRAQPNIARAKTQFKTTDIKTQQNLTMTCKPKNLILILNVGLQK